MEDRDALTKLQFEEDYFDAYSCENKKEIDNLSHCKHFYWS